MVKMVNFMYAHACSITPVMSNFLQPMDHDPPGSSVHGIL